MVGFIHQGLQYLHLYFVLDTAQAELETLHQLGSKSASNLLEPVFFKKRHCELVICVIYLRDQKTYIHVFLP